MSNSGDEDFWDLIYDESNKISEWNCDRLNGNNIGENESFNGTGADCWGLNDDDEWLSSAW